MGNKFFTLSFDDGVEQDLKLIDVLKKYDMPCTFNLNSGLMGEKAYTAHVGAIGFMDIRPDETLKRKLFRTVEHNRLSEDECRSVYEGYEIASHCYRHETLAKADQKTIDQAIDRDISNLERIFGKKITGFAYPGGIGSDLASKALKEKGLLFGRLAFTSGKYEFPENPYLYKPTCSHKDKHIFSLLDQFIHDPGEEDLLFFVWGHAYEFDYGIENAGLDHLEKVLQTVRKHPEIICCTNSEAFMGHAKNR